MENSNIEVRRDNRPMEMPDVVPDMERMFDNMVDRFFGTRVNSLMGDWADLPRRNATSVQETDQAYVLTAELPGIPKDDIKISVNGNLLAIHAEHKLEDGSERSTGGFRRQYRSFHQSFALPTTIDVSQVEAHYEDGVLELMLPKTEQAQAKTIEVQSGKGGFLQRLLKKSGVNSQVEGGSEAKH